MKKKYTNILPGKATNNEITSKLPGVRKRSFLYLAFLWSYLINFPGNFTKS